MENNEIDKWDQVVTLVEKWGLTVLILSLYFFFSSRIMFSLSQPVLTENICGNGAFGAILIHFIFAGIVLIILSFTLFIKDNFSFIFKIIIAISIIILPFISCMVF